MDENKAIWSILVAGTLLVMVFALFSCKSQRVVTVTEYKERVVRDTITRIDSVYVADSIVDKQRERHSGDTIFVERVVERWRTQWKIKVETQTVEVHSTDSIPYPVEVVREVPRERSGYDRFINWAFWILIVIGLAALGYTLNRRFGWCNILLKIILRK